MRVQRQGVGLHVLPGWIDRQGVAYEEGQVAVYFAFLTEDASSHGSLLMEKRGWQCCVITSVARAGHAALFRSCRGLCVLHFVAKGEVHEH